MTEVLMATSLEFKGKNIDKALETASATLKIPKDRLKYKVISYGSSGIFGLAGTRKARIRVIPIQSPHELPAVANDDNTITEAMAAAVEPDFPGQKYSKDQNSADDRQFYDLPEDPLDLGRSVLQRIVDSITDDAQVAVAKNSDEVLFNVAGGNASLLIGKRGQTLEAIQSIVEKAVNKHNHNRIRIRVDIEGYLETRRSNLEKMALRLADKSARIHKPISLGQMSAYDRRIIHLALKNHPGVRTQSKGEGYLRKLVIFPRKNNDKRKSEQEVRS
jgi:spoIIIJ-associated protein